MKYFKLIPCKFALVLALSTPSFASTSIHTGYLNPCDTLTFTFGGSFTFSTYWEREMLPQIQFEAIRAMNEGIDSPALKAIRAQLRLQAAEAIRNTSVEPTSDLFPEMNPEMYDDEIGNDLLNQQIVSGFQKT